MARLQEVTAALSAAAAEQEVAEVILGVGLHVLGASGGSLCFPAGGVLEVAHAAGSMAAADGTPGALRAPLEEAFLREEPVWIGSADDLRTRYPALVPAGAAVSEAAWAALPLRVRGRTVGALGIGFAGAHAFGEEERGFIEALAHHCAQAVDRARLYETQRELRAQAEEAAETRELLVRELRRTLRERDESAALLDALFGNAPVGLALLDREMRYLRVNAYLAGAARGPGRAAARPDASGRSRRRWPATTWSATSTRWPRGARRSSERTVVAPPRVPGEHPADLRRHPVPGDGGRPAHRRGRAGARGDRAAHRRAVAPPRPRRGRPRPAQPAHGHHRVGRAARRRAPRRAGRPLGGAHPARLRAHGRHHPGAGRLHRGAGRAGHRAPPAPDRARRRWSARWPRSARRPTPGAPCGSRPPSRFTESGTGTGSGRRWPTWWGTRSSTARRTPRWRRPAGATADEAVVEVTNAGAPIPAELVPHLFEPFRRGDDERSQRRKGLGLGLYIAVQIAAAHGGNIRVRSDAATGHHLLGAAAAVASAVRVAERPERPHGRQAGQQRQRDLPAVAAPPVQVGQDVGERELQEGARRWRPAPPR